MADTLTSRAPALRVRMAVFVYEGLMLFGVLMLVALVYGIATQQTHALHGKLGLQLSCFAAIGLYFAYFWCRGGQTLPMQTWRVRLLRASDLGPVTARQALTRYLLAWMWFLPGLTVAYLAGWHSSSAVSLALSVNVLAVALASRLHPQGQFWHDALAGTVLVRLPKPEPRPKDPR